MKHFVCALCVFAWVSFAVLAQDPNWNQFRGPNSNNHSASTGLATSWGEGGPKELWRVSTLGLGYANICFFGDKMFTMGDFDNQCYAIAMDKTGQEIWKVHIGRGGDSGMNFIGPFSTPACDGETVYVLSQHGDFAALDVKDGKERWKKNIINEHGADKMAMWGYSMSPILDGDKILLPLGGNAGTLAAFDKTGKILWRTDWVTDKAAYTTIVPAEIGGVRQYLLLTGGNLFGVSTDGKKLWGAEFPGRTAVCSDPVVSGDVILAGCAYNVGAYSYRVTKDGDAFKVDRFSGPKGKNKDGEDVDLQSHHGGMVAVGEHFYFLTNSSLVCIEAKSGNVVWENAAVGKGSLSFADGKLFLRHEGAGGGRRGGGGGGGGSNGTIAMVEATPTGYKELGRFAQPDRSNVNSWTYPTIVDKKMYIRDQGLLLCYPLD
jgi:outer membrane protein assembly factor BamB